MANLRYWPAYALAVVGLGVLRWLPLSWSVALARGLWRVVYLVMPRRRAVAERQIAAALRVDPERAAAITRGVYRHLGTLLAEVAQIRRLDPEALDPCIDYGDTLEVSRRLLAEGKGLVVATGHLGNWEAASAAARPLGEKLFTVARPLDNPLLNRLVNGWRERLGMKVEEKGPSAMRSALRSLRAGGIFILLIDQDAGLDGRFVPFFGISASTITAASELSLRTGAPILVQALMRDGDRPMRFRCLHGEVIRPNPDAPDREAEVLRLMAAVHADLEPIIRAAPEQWLWLHRRWKTRPPGEKDPTAMPGRGA